MKRILALILFASMLASVAACGTEGGSSDTTTASGGDESSDTTLEDTTTAEEYIFPELDLGGESFKVLNTITNWHYYTTFDLEEQTGDLLDDTVYNRNRDIEEMFKIKFEVTDKLVDDVPIVFLNQVYSGEDFCDITIVQGNNVQSMLDPDCLVDLSALDGLNLDEDWWDQNITQLTKLGGAQYFAANYASLLGLEGTTCMFFNKQMLDDIGLESPYKLVLDGKWTLDKVKEYNEVATDLNGDDSFEYNPTGNARYGFIGWHKVVDAFWTGSGVATISREDNKLALGADSERFADVCEKIAAITSQDGFISLNKSTLEHYEQAFKSDRSLLSLGQFKSVSNVYRDMESDYGIIPSPKFDEAQEEYYSYSPNGFTIIPVTNPDADTTAIITDALAYLSYKDLLPAYYDTVLSYKALRDEDSLEMLDIIRRGMIPDLSTLYSVGVSMTDTIRNAVLNGDSVVASKVASAKEAVESEIESVNEKFGA